MRHCALCDVTHGLFRRKAEWDRCAAELAVPFTTYHRDDAPADVRAAAGGAYPVVLARTDRGLEVVLTTAQIEACSGSPRRSSTCSTLWGDHPAPPARLGP